jgi:hypothetical protein
MFRQPWFIRAVLSVACLVVPLSYASLVRAGPVISFGGGVSDGGLLNVQNDPWAPLAWVSVGGSFDDSWSGFARGGYERHRVWSGLVTCQGIDCPQVLSAERQATYVPLSVGLRLSAPRPALSSLRVYVEAAASVAWARYEAQADLAFPGGNVVRELRLSDHWLPGVELGAGFNQRVGRGLGLECGLRYAYRALPRSTVATVGFDTGRDGFSQVSLVGALTMGR